MYLKKLTSLLVLLTVLGLILTGCQKEPLTNQVESDQGEITFRANQVQSYDMNDRFATETGATGFGKCKTNQKNGRIVVQLIQAKNLIPNHEYEFKVTVDLAAVYTSACMTANPSGHLKITNLDLGADFDPGEYRLDLFVTHCQPTVSGSGPTGAFLTGLMDRDPLLACEPAVNVIVE